MRVSKEELLARARKPAQDAMRLHPFYRGKMQTVPKCSIRSLDDLAIWYTPGVAEPCWAIKADKERVYEFTNKWNTIAVVSDGTRVLGLGDIGPEAGLPVMEGKALLFKYLGGVDAVPICLDTKDPDEIIKAVKWLQPSFGGINLEDIATAYELAKCAEDRGISEDNIAPTMGEWEVFIREAVAVAMKAQEQGVARITASREELTKQAEMMIRQAREMTALLMEAGYIPPAPEH